MWLHPALEPLLQLQAHARPDFGCGHISISNLGSGLVWGSFSPVGYDFGSTPISGCNFCSGPILSHGFSSSRS